MGLTIHYRGKLADLEQVKTISDELIRIAEKMNWEWTSFDEDWDKPASAKFVTNFADGSPTAQISGHLPLKGVALTPEGAESLFFFFDPEGKLCHPLGMILIMDGKLRPEDAWVSVKTQFSSTETHIWIVGLLRYLKAHYIPDLEVHDEGEYWETGSFETLKGKTDFLTGKMDAISNELSRVSRGHVSEFSAEEVASMIEGLIREKIKPDDVKTLPQILK